ncbi:DUF5342 family protein [Sporosarcina sp. HYO08]|uniref:DUF5342 family protein n=1 Tax=Sporosarcina sp. HYO08 TaxID=1759557 RepID=UPI00079116BE|nr:DUF5342 family protein [Sporosarcina sp. HYO08]KXH79308.1 hypothetical protein AU377_12060 [Sporosarcina sp. HYO08]
MLQHFRYQPMYINTKLPGWTFTFMLQNERYEGEYASDGIITWVGKTPPNEDNVKKMIHELMTYHVYE